MLTIIAIVAIINYSTINKWKGGGLRTKWGQH